MAVIAGDWLLFLAIGCYCWRLAIIPGDWLLLLAIGCCYLSYNSSVCVCVCVESSHHGLSKEKMAEIQTQIDADRKRLESMKDMEEEEKLKIERNLEGKEQELRQAQ